MTTPQTREHHNQENRLDNKHGDHSWDTELVPSKLMPQSLDAAFFVLPGPIASLSALRTVHHHLHGGGTTRMASTIASTPMASTMPTKSSARSVTQRMLPSRFDECE